MITRFEFADRASLWSADSGSKYIPAPNLGTRTGMSRERYDTIQQHLVWSKRPPHRAEEVSSETYRWMLVADFVTNINDHRKKYFMPSFIICVDESISRWYGLGGHWINMGLPMYVAFDRKPEDGCEIQNACCGKSGIMMQLRLVRTAAGEVNVERVAQEQDGAARQENREADGAAADSNGYDSTCFVVRWCCYFPRKLHLANYLFLVIANYIHALARQQLSPWLQCPLQFGEAMGQY